ncbi:MAG TPA: Bax inhibitor-1 family protein [Arenicellales bacterium]|nr:Bax inhibitor-1 family protein [Arenicellales bacterium]
MNPNQLNQAVARPQAAGVEVNKVLKNTYILLSLTLLFCAATAGMSMAFNWPHPGLILTLVGYFGLLFATSYFRNSALGLVFVFALTGFMGLTLGPIISQYLTVVPNGHQVVMTAMGATGIIFLGLSGYALVSRKDFSFMAGFLFSGILVAFLAGLGAAIFQIPALSLAVSAMFVLLMSGNGLLDCEHYTRPEEFRGSGVPPVLLSGDHGAIERWRLKSALRRTWLRRPDLLREAALSKEMEDLLEEFKREYEAENQ